jgi:sec-independent protein translocase protein TatC
VQSETTLALLYLLLVLGTGGAVAAILYRRVGRPLSPDAEVSVLGHLEELRGRLLRVVLHLAAWMTMFLTLHVETTRWSGLSIPYPTFNIYDNVAAQVYRALADVVVPDGVQLLVASPTEAVAAQMQIAFVLAILVTIPFLIHELWGFLGPGLRAAEQRFMRRAFPAAILLFAVGASFGFLVIVPLLFDVLYAFAAPLGATTYLSVGSLVGTVTLLTLLFGVAFELPLAMIALVRVGLVHPDAYFRRWRAATITIFIVAALATDPTLLSQMIVGSILLGLYFGGAGASHLVHRRVQAQRTAVAS